MHFMQRTTGRRTMKAISIGGAMAMLLAGGVCLAQSEGGVIRGNSNINVNVGDVNTMAIGSGNTAKTSIGSVKAGSKGGANVTVDVKNVSNVVSGHGKKGCINIGTQGTDNECK